MSTERQKKVNALLSGARESRHMVMRCGTEILVPMIAIELLLEEVV